MYYFAVMIHNLLSKQRTIFSHDSQMGTVQTIMAKNKTPFNKGALLFSLNVTFSE